MTRQIRFPSATSSGSRLLLTRHQVLTWCGKHSILYSEHWDNSEYTVSLTDEKMLTLFVLAWQGEEFYIETEKFVQKIF